MGAAGGRVQTSASASCSVLTMRRPTRWCELGLAGHGAVALRGSVRRGTPCSADFDGQSAMSQYCARGTGDVKMNRHSCCPWSAHSGRCKGRLGRGRRCHPAMLSPATGSGTARVRMCGPRADREAWLGCVIGGGLCLSEGVTVCAGGQEPVPDTASCPRPRVPRGRVGEGGEAAWRPRRPRGGAWSLLSRGE